MTSKPNTPQGADKMADLRERRAAAKAVALAEQEKKDAEKAEREAKAARKAAAIEAIEAAAEEQDPSAPWLIERYEELPAVVAAGLTPGQIEGALKRFAAEYEIDASDIYSGAARTSRWNGRFDRAAVLYGASIKLTGSKLATANQNYWTRLKTATVAGDKSGMTKAQGQAEFDRLEAIRKAIPDENWEAIVEAIDAAYIAGEAAVAAGIVGADDDDDADDADDAENVESEAPAA